MANTIIQIKRSSATSAPVGGSLSAAEPAYSYLSEKLFLGDAAGTDVVEIGGKYWVDHTKRAFDQANAAYQAANVGNNEIVFNQANTARDQANAAYNMANTANAYAYNVGLSGNSYAVLIGDSANAYSRVFANSVGTSANAYTRVFANSVGDSANAYTRVFANSVGTSANAYAASAGISANNYSDSTFVKLISPSQTITGNLAVTGSLTVSGNAFSIDTETLRVSDPLIYLAGNNYSSDIVDIGFVANYNNGSANLHTGLFRDATVKEYYLFQGYNKEPDPNHIDTTGNNFTLAVLNADIKTSNLTLGGANAILTIGAAFDKANAANLLAFNTGIGANAYSRVFANSVGDSANAYVRVFANSVGDSANAYSRVFANSVGDSANAYTRVFANSVGDSANAYTRVFANSVGTSANAYADAVGTAANTNAANGSYISTGIVKVPYGGTGRTSFVQNGILFGNTAGDLKVTNAGTEGQVLQASATGVPQFGHLDGGSF